FALDAGTTGSWSCPMHRFPHGRSSGFGVSAGSAWQRLRQEGSDADEYSSWASERGAIGSQEPLAAIRNPDWNRPCETRTRFENRSRELCILPRVGILTGQSSGDRRYVRG